MANALKRILRPLVPARLRRRLRAHALIEDRLDEIGDVLRAQHASLRRLAGLVLRRDYAALGEPGTAPTLNGAELKVFSQNGEDGILLEIFRRIGATNRRFVEFGVGDGTECNSANLSINFGWRGLLMDRDADSVEAARRYYRRMGADVRVERCLVTVDNIDEALVRHRFGGDIDLLSIDIDGNDYWVWRAATAARPRVVVIEYNASFGPERPLTVAYDPDFDRMAKHPSGFYHGSSLSALVKLAHAKGYVLAACDSQGVNAFFVRGDAAEGKLLEPSVPEAFFPNARRLHALSTEEQFAAVARMPFEQV